MPKILNNPRDNSLSLYGLVDLHDSWLDQPLNRIDNPTFNDIFLSGDATISGNLRVNGSTTIVNTDILTIKDNIIEINSAETSAGVSSNLAGISINRGTLADYVFIFEESSDTFRVGQVNDTQAVATREDNPASNGIMIYNSTTKRLEATNTIPNSTTFSSEEMSTMSSDGTVRIRGGLGITGDIVTDGKIVIKGTSYTNYIDSNISEEFIFRGGSNIIFSVPSSSYIKIPSGVLLSFGDTLNNITSSSMNLDIASAGQINIMSGIGQPVNIRTNSPLTFGTSGEKITFDGTNLNLSAGNSFVVSPITNFTNNTHSSNSSTGSLKIGGGISISNTSDAINSGSGGTITTAGGVAIAKKLFVGGATRVENVDELTSLVVLGGTSISKKISLGSDYSGNPASSDAIYFQVPSHTYTDNTTSISGTVTNIHFNSIGAPVLAASNNSVTTTNASTFYIGGSPVSGENQFITNSYSLYINSGLSRINGDVQIKSSTYSTDSTTGALVVDGGVSIKQNLSVSKKFDVSSYVNSAPSSSGIFLSLSPSTINDNTTTTIADEMLFNVISRPTLLSTNIITTTNSATFTIDNSPLQGPSQTIINSYSLWIKDGITKMGSTIESSSPTSGSLQLLGSIGISNTADSINSTSGGTFTTAGGASIAKKLFLGGIFTVEDTTISTSSITGSIITGGGVGIQKGANIGQRLFAGKDNFMIFPSTGVVLNTCGNEITDNFTQSNTSTNIVSLINFGSSKLNATNTGITTSNAINVYIQGPPTLGTNQTIINSYSLYVNTGKSSFGGQVIVTDSTSSISPITGAVIVTGGIGISGNINVASDMNVGGISNLSRTNIDTTNGTLNVTGVNGMNVDLNSQISISNTTGSIDVNSKNGSLVLIGQSEITIDSNGGFSIDSNANSNINTSFGILTIGAPVVDIAGVNNVNISSNSGININSLDTVNGIKIGTTTMGIPITIGNAVSEVLFGNNVTIDGILTVNGTTTTVNSTLITIFDNAIIVNSMPSGLSDGGLLVRRYQIPTNDGAGGQIVLDTPYSSSTFQENSTSTSVVLNSSEVNVSNFYRGWWIKITSGISSGRVRRIKSYDNASHVAEIYTTADNDASMVDGLDLDIIPTLGDSYNLYPGTYGGMFFDDTNDEWVIGKVPYDAGAGKFPLHGYHNLHINSLVVEGGINYGGDSLFDGSLTLDVDSDKILLARKNGNTGNVFYINTNSPSATLCNPIFTLNSTIPLNFSQHNTSNVETLYSRIQSKILANVSGNISGSLEFGVLRNSVLENYLTLNGNTHNIETLRTLYLGNTTSSTNSSVGGLVMEGGIAIANTADASSSINGGCITVSGGIAVAKTGWFGNSIVIGEDTTPALSSVQLSINNIDSTGIQFQRTGSSTSSIGVNSSDNMVFSLNTASRNFLFQDGDGDYSVSSNVRFNIGTSQISTAITTDSSSITTGSIVTGGGVGIAKKLYVGSDLFVFGNILSGTWQGSIVSPIYGGTGVDTLASNSILIGNGTGAIQSPLNLTFANNVLSCPKILTTDTTDAVSPSSAPVILTGGLGVAKKVYVGDSLYTVGNIGIGTSTNVNNSITFSGDSTIGLNTNDTNDNGSISISGGGLVDDTRGSFIKVNGNESSTGGSINLVAGNNNSHGYINFTTASLQRLSIAYNGESTFNLTTDSASSTSGSIIVSGGMGIAKKLYIGTELNVAGNSNIGTISSGVWNGSVVDVIYGGTGQTSLTNNSVLLGNGTNSIQSPSDITYSSNTLFLPKIASNDISQSTSQSTGAITTLGGIGIAKNLYVGQDIYTVGNIGVGTSSNINSAITLSSNSNIGINTLVTADTGVLTLSGSGTASNNRGSLISLSGNQETNTGLLALYAGNTSGGSIKLYTQGISRISVDYNGITTFSKATNSTSSDTGALVISNGGLGINGTLNATSSTNGGTLTVAGGASIAQDIYIGGNLFVAGSVPGAVIISPQTSSTFNLVNITSSTSTNCNVMTTDNQRTLSGIFLVTPSASNATCSFDFTLPAVVANFSNSHDLIASVQGYQDSTFYSIENIVCYAITGNTRGKIKFTSGSTNQHVLQFIIRYSI